MDGQWLARRLLSAAESVVDLTERTSFFIVGMAGAAVCLFAVMDTQEDRAAEQRNAAKSLFVEACEALENNAPTSADWLMPIGMMCTASLFEHTIPAAEFLSGQAARAKAEGSAAHAAERVAAAGLAGVTAGAVLLVGGVPEDDYTDMAWLGSVLAVLSEIAIGTAALEDKAVMSGLTGRRAIVGAMRIQLLRADSAPLADVVSGGRGAAAPCTVVRAEKAAALVRGFRPGGAAGPEPLALGLPAQGGGIGGLVAVGWQTRPVAQCLVAAAASGAAFLLGMAGAAAVMPGGVGLRYAAAVVAQPNAWFVRRLPALAALTPRPPVIVVAALLAAALFETLRHARAAEGQGRLGGARLAFARGLRSHRRVEVPSVAVAMLEAV